MADDKRYMGFWIGHLHQGERNRIHLDGPNHQEREMLAKGEDPWAKFRGQLPPDIQPQIATSDKPEPPKDSEPPKAEPLRDDGSKDRVTPIELGPASDEVREDGHSDAEVRDYFDRKTSPHDHHILSINSQAKPFGEPWHKRGELVLAVVLACVGLVVAIALVMLPPTSPRAIIFWLLVMFVLLAVSELLTARFFDWSRRVTGGLLAVPAIVVIVFGFYAWPEVAATKAVDGSAALASPTPVQPLLVKESPSPTAKVSPIPSPTAQVMRIQPSASPIFVPPGFTPAPVTAQLEVIGGSGQNVLEMLRRQADYTGPATVLQFEVRSLSQTGEQLFFGNKNVNEKTGFGIDDTRYWGTVDLADLYFYYAKPGRVVVTFVWLKPVTPPQ